MEKNRIKSIIESLLFVVEKPIKIEKFYGIFDQEQDKDSLLSILQEIKNELENDENRGVKLEEVASGWQLRTKEENQQWIKKLENIKPIRLSQPALEVLAIIAYKQPINRAEVDKIRGVDSSHLFRVLMERNIIKISGRADLPGRPLLYSTTPEFLEVFGLRDLTELPSYNEIQEISSKAIGDPGDIKEDVNLSLKLLVEEEQETATIAEDTNSQELLDKLSEIGKELKVDIDLVQEKVDIIFEDTCRKYATQRKEIYSNTETENQ